MSYGETAMPDQNPKYQRSLRSLNVLAARFVKLLQEAEGGTLDLKEVSELRPFKHTAKKTRIPSLEIWFLKCH
uniref:Uncharacterized protein n=1 Tax=Seriola lalandi dorsalis TaxID=1841481 RepID=A0A3B4XEK2_SERLL